MLLNEKIHREEKLKIHLYKIDDHINQYHVHISNSVHIFLFVDVLISIGQDPNDEMEMVMYKCDYKNENQLVTYVTKMDYQMNELNHLTSLILMI